MPVEKTCGYCAASFQVPVRRHETVKFCSVACKDLAKRRTVTCPVCATSFTKPKHDDFTKYCSKVCYHSASIGVAKNVDDRPRYYRTCEVCSSEFRVTFTRKDTARFCSMDCQFKSPTRLAEMSEAQKGEKSHLWKGGLYKRGSGYVRERGQDIDAKTFRFEHRLVMERAMLAQAPDHPFLVEVDGIKRLDRKIEVHHIDLDRSHNAFTNLLAVTKQAHAQIHHNNRIPQPWECWPFSHIGG